MSLAIDLLFTVYGDTTVSVVVSLPIYLLFTVYRDTTALVVLCLWVYYIYPSSPVLCFWLTLVSLLIVHCLRRYHSVCSVVSLAIYLLFTVYRDTTASVSCVSGYILTVLTRPYRIITASVVLYQITTASVVLYLCL